MIAALPPILDCTCIISDTATDMADIIPLRPNWHRALSARAEHRVGARAPVWRLI